jgi:hypothetical protein
MPDAGAIGTVPDGLVGEVEDAVLVDYQDYH